MISQAYLTGLHKSSDQECIRRWVKECTSRSDQNSLEDLIRKALVDIMRAVKLDDRPATVSLIRNEICLKGLHL
jgi:hypothetical protein